MEIYPIRIIKIVFVIVSAVILSSCTSMVDVPRRQLVKSHETVMRSFLTKEQVYSKLGSPDRIVFDERDGEILSYGLGNKYLNFYCTESGAIYKHKSNNYDLSEYRTVMVREEQDSTMDFLFVSSIVFVLVIGVILIFI